VFENYGQPNHIYLTYHGFALKENTHDCTLLAIGLPSWEHERIDWGTCLFLCTPLLILNFHLTLTLTLTLTGNAELIKLARSYGLAPNTGKYTDKPRPGEVGTDACLGPSIKDVPKNVWVLLALKAGTIDDYMASGLLGEPEDNARNILLGLVNLQLKEMPIDFERVHQPMVRVMLQGEREVLERLQTSLAAAAAPRAAVKYFTDEL